jgi:GxxExxY protein
MEINQITERIIGAAIEVYKHLGPGLLESAYQNCLAREMTIRSIVFEKEQALPLKYKGVLVDCGYRLDFLVEQAVIVEEKSVESLHPIYEAQLMTYLKLTGCKVGLLINFNVPLLKHGIKRMIL